MMYMQIDNFTCSVLGTWNVSIDTYNLCVSFLIFWYMFFLNYYRVFCEKIEHPIFTFLSFFRLLPRLEMQPQIELLHFII